MGWKDKSLNSCFQEMINWREVPPHKKPHPSLPLCQFDKNWILLPSSNRSDMEQYQPFLLIVLIYFLLILLSLDAKKRTCGDVKFVLYKAMKRKEGCSDISSYTHFDSSGKVLDYRKLAGVKDLTNIMSDGRTSILIHTLMGSHPNLLPPPCWPHLVLKESGGPPQQGGEGGGGSLLIRRLIFPMALTSLLTNSPRAKPKADNFSDYIFHCHWFQLIWSAQIVQFDQAAVDDQMQFCHMLTNFQLNLQQSGFFSVHPPPKKKFDKFHIQPTQKYVPILKWKSIAKQSRFIFFLFFLNIT